MKRKLFTQISNEWRNNFWIVVELIIVGATMWYAVNILWTIAAARLIPTGYDTTDTYIVTYNQLNATTADDPDSSHDFATLVDRLRQNPGVLAIGAGDNAAPYNYNYMGCTLIAADGKDSIYQQVNRRYMNPDMAKVLNLKGTDGQTSEQLAEIMRRGEVLVGIDPSTQPGRYNLDLVGRIVTQQGDSTSVYRVGALIPTMKRNDYEPPYGGTIIIPISDERLYMANSNELWVRCRPGTGKAFMEHIREKAETDYAVGNYYVTGISTVEQLRATNQSNYSQTILISMVSVIFLAVSIFLGLLGTFWFRTQQRTSEIAIRKVNGANDGSIFRRLVSEGLLLLSMAVPFMALLVWFLANNGLTIGDEPPTIATATGCLAIAVALLMLMIFLGILFPARKAMRVNPAIALKDE